MASTWGLSWLNSWGNSWNRSSTPAPDVATKGGIPLGEWKRYRKKLESISKAAEKFDRKKLIEKAPDIVEIAEAVDVSAPEIKELIRQSEAQEPVVFDFSKIQAELIDLITRLNVLLEQKQRVMDELNDEEALLLLI